MDQGVCYGAFPRGSVAGRANLRPRPCWQMQALPHMGLMPSRPRAGAGFEVLTAAASARVSHVTRQSGGNRWKVFRDGLGRPRLAQLTELMLKLLLCLCLGAKVRSTEVFLDAETNLDVVLGRIKSLRFQIGCTTRGLRLQRGHLQYEAADWGFKPWLMLLSPLIMLFRPALALPLLVCVLFLPGRILSGSQEASSGIVSTQGRFSIHLAGSDLNESGLWRFFLTAALRDIMECSVAGLVALPREVSGELSAATSFELEGVSIEDSCLAMDAVAKLPDGVLFKYRIRTGATLVQANGENVVFWEDPCIRVTPMWPLPSFWAPLGGFASRRLGTWLQLTRLEFPKTGGLDMEGALGRGGSTAVTRF